MFTTRSKCTLASFVLFACPALQAASIIYYSGPSTGGFTQTTYAPVTTVANSLVCTVPEFNPALGTLVQASFEYVPSSTATWYSIPPTGTCAVNLNGLADVSGTSMGNINLAYSGTIYDSTATSYFGLGIGTLVVSGPAVNAYVGLGSETLTWNYSGTTTLSVASFASTGFDLGGTAHVLYEYIPIPEPTALLWIAPATTLISRRRRRNLRANQFAG